MTPPEMAHYEIQLQKAYAAVGNAFSAAKAEATEAEIALWSEAIRRVGPDAALSFMGFWLSGGGQDKYARAPRVNDMLEFVDPNYVNAVTGLGQLRDLVASVGPYQSPNVLSPMLRAAVLRLGGWAKVCEDMPDPIDEFAWKRFQDRFELSWRYSEALAVQGLLNPPALIGLVDASQALPAVTHHTHAAVAGPSDNGLSCAPG